MKAGKRPTRSQKAHLTSIGLSPSEWLISKREQFQWVVVHRYTGQVKYVRGEGWR